MNQLLYSLSSILLIYLSPQNSCPTPMSSKIQKILSPEHPSLSPHPWSRASFSAPSSLVQSILLCPLIPGPEHPSLLPHPRSKAPFPSSSSLVQSTLSWPLIPGSTLWLLPESRQAHPAGHRLHWLQILSCAASSSPAAWEG